MTLLAIFGLFVIFWWITKGLSALERIFDSVTERISDHFPAPLRSVRTTKTRRHIKVIKSDPFMKQVRKEISEITK